MKNKWRVCRVLLLLFLFGFGQAVFSDVNEIQKGKSSLINETSETITIDYILCEYDYDHGKKTVSNENCKQSSITMEANLITDFELNPSIVGADNIQHLKKIFIKKISGGHTYQYFISDSADEASYRNYKNRNNRQGVDKKAFSCSFFYETDIHIYASSKGFICH